MSLQRMQGLVCRVISYSVVSAFISYTTAARHTTRCAAGMCFECGFANKNPNTDICHTSGNAV
jgi:hypothetical protein